MPVTAVSVVGVLQLALEQQRIPGLMCHGADPARKLMQACVNLYKVQIYCTRSYQCHVIQTLGYMIIYYYIV
jgi:hypothetical protein